LRTKNKNRVPEIIIKIMKIKYILSLAFVLFFCCIGKAQESMIPNISYSFLEKLITAAKTNYPRYKTFEKNLEVARLGVEKAKWDWMNLFAISWVYSPTNATTATTPSLNGYQMAATSNIGNVFLKPNQVKTARRQYEAAQAGLEEYDLNITAEVKKRYFTYIEQETIFNWRTKALEDAESLLKQLKYKFEKGEETYENYTRAQGGFSSAVQAKIESETAFLIAKSSLEEIVGSKLEDIK